MRTRKSTRVTGAISTRGLAASVGACLLLATLVGAHAWARVEGTMVGYRLSAAQADQEELLREQRALELELATRRAAARIEGDARTRLGLVEPSPEQIIPIRPRPQREDTAVAQVGTAR